MANYNYRKIDKWGNKPQGKTHKKPNLIKKYSLIALGVVVVLWLSAFVKRMLDRLNARDEMNQNKIEVDLVTNKEKTAQQINSAQNTVGNPTVMQSKEQALRSKYVNVSKSRMTEIIASAHIIAAALKTNPSNIWFNKILGFEYESGSLSSVFEDEATAVRELKRYPGSFQILSEAYYTLATASRNLKADCYKYLSESDLNEIRAKHKPYKNL